MLLALPAGLWVERRRRRPVLVLSNLAQAMLLSLVPLLAVAGLLDVWHLVAVAQFANLLGVPYSTLLPHPWVEGIAHPVSLVG